MQVKDLQKELLNYDPSDDFVFERGKMIIVTQEYPHAWYDCHFHEPDKDCPTKYDTTLNCILGEIKQRLIVGTCH